VQAGFRAFSDVDDRLHERARSFLRRVVADAAREQAMRIFAGEAFA
jgi:hypothetical protein